MRAFFSSTASASAGNENDSCPFRSGAVSYLLINFLMTAAPLAMHICGHSHTVSGRR